MVIYQAVFVAFTGLALLAAAVAIRVIIRSKVLTFKPLWIIGSMVGLVGLGIDWTRPADLFLQFGIQIPFIRYSELPNSGSILLKTLFPVIALVAIYRDRAGRSDEVEVFR